MTHHTGVRKCLVTNGQRQHRADPIGVLGILLKMVNCCQRCLCTAQTPLAPQLKSIFLLLCKGGGRLHINTAWDPAGQQGPNPPFPSTALLL